MVNFKVLRKRYCILGFLAVTICMLFGDLGVINSFFIVLGYIIGGILIIVLERRTIKQNKVLMCQQRKFMNLKNNFEEWEKSCDKNYRNTLHIFVHAKFLLTLNEQSSHLKRVSKKQRRELNLMSLELKEMIERLDVKLDYLRNKGFI